MNLRLLDSFVFKFLPNFSSWNVRYIHPFNCSIPLLQNSAVSDAQSFQFSYLKERLRYCFKLVTFRNLQVNKAWHDYLIIIIYLAICTCQIPFFQTSQFDNLELLQHCKHNLESSLPHIWDLNTKTYDQCISIYLCSLYGVSQATAVPLKKVIARSFCIHV